MLLNRYKTSQALNLQHDELFDRYHLQLRLALIRSVKLISHFNSLFSEVLRTE